MNNKFITNVINHNISDDILDETYHVNIDVSTDSEKYNIKIKCKDPENGQYLLFALHIITSAIATRLSKEYEMEVKEILNLIVDLPEGLDNDTLESGLALEVINE